MKRFTENYTGERFDVVVIGGGITGAAVAYDAASRGLSVALIEKGDFGSATSSATSNGLLVVVPVRRMEGGRTGKSSITSRCSGELPSSDRQV